MPLSAPDYRPRNAEHAVLYRVIDEHLEAFLETARRHADGASLPEFVKQEFGDFLTCGVLAHGFARLRCTDCAFERLVPFSCKGRGFCPSCGGRRMAECAARLVDDVLPRVPVRQWVLSLPHRLRYLLAWDHALARAVLGVYVRVLLGFQRHRARRYGIRDGRSGCVTVIQRALPLSAPPGGGSGPTPAPGRWPYRAHAQDRVGGCTRDLVFEPLELLEKLAALTPRPRINLVLYHVLAPHAGGRAHVVAYGAPPVEAPAAASASVNENDDPVAVSISTCWPARAAASTCA